jgi:hypothetical protein
MHRFVRTPKTQHLQELHDSAGLPERESQSWMVAAGIARGKYAFQRVYSDEVNYTTSERLPLLRLGSRGGDAQLALALKIDPRREPLALGMVRIVSLAVPSREMSERVERQLANTDRLFLG